MEKWKGSSGELGVGTPTVSGSRCGVGPGGGGLEGMEGEGRTGGGRA